MENFEQVGLKGKWCSIKHTATLNRAIQLFAKQRSSRNLTVLVKTSQKFFYSYQFWHGSMRLSTRILNISLELIFEFVLAEKFRKKPLRKYDFSCFPPKSIFNFSLWKQHLKKNFFLWKCSELKALSTLRMSSKSKKRFVMAVEFPWKYPGYIVWEKNSIEKKREMHEYRCFT